MAPQASDDPLAFANPAVRRWFAERFDGPTLAQQRGWPSIASGGSTLLLAPTGSGKTLAAFMVAIDRLMFEPEAREPGCRVLYVSPLKALGVDVEKNLRQPVEGIFEVAASMGIEARRPLVGIRSGDTPQKERARHLRNPPEILITTPESLYLMLTSRARAFLESVETVIVDEIHSLVATKRGTHLFLSLERLEAERRSRTPLQRIGLSATQRPLDEVARLLGGCDVQRVAPAEGASEGTLEHSVRARPVSIIDAGRRRPFEVTVEVPVDDMRRMQIDGGAAPEEASNSIWPAIYPRLLELIREHRTTMIFANSRRLAEKISRDLNELAGETVARSHHGSVARATRLEIEDELKRGALPAIVATSTLELGIDMGSVDLVIQIEAPPSIASGVQRIGRAGHHVGGRSLGRVFPKFRGDLLASAAATAEMYEGRVEATRYPRRPLDVLAQQIVAIVSVDDECEYAVDELYRLVRSAAPYADLSRATFDGVLDLLAGRYPSDEFAGLRPRIVWNRREGSVRGRRGAKRIAIVNGGTIPDRGLYGVFMVAGEGRSASRVGELDEEMVFESEPGDVFVLGASSWRIMDITHDRVLVSPAPGQPGRMPFWKGEGPGRPLELGRAIGALARDLSTAEPALARVQLAEKHGLEPRAAENLMSYIADQAEATGVVPNDRCLVIERIRDERGDWRVVVLSPFGARVHAPWAMAVRRRLRQVEGIESDMMWSDDGMVFRVPEADRTPVGREQFLPGSEEIESMVVAELGHTALFASHFRENAARALLLPRHMPGRRMPLWVQRRRSADLLQVAGKFPDFPIILETYRECLRDFFDLPGLVEILAKVESREMEVQVVDSRTPSPFANAVLFNYVAQYLYEEDAPPAERRLQALALDHAQLRQLLGEAELRELLVPEVIAETESSLQHLVPERRVRHVDALHDLFLDLGTLSMEEVEQRSEPGAPVAAWLEELVENQRVIPVRVGGEERFGAVEDAARFRDVFASSPPDGLPTTFLEPVAAPAEDLVSRYARTHGPFTAEQVVRRFGSIAPVLVERALEELAEAGRVVEGSFSAELSGRQWCDGGVLQTLKRRSLAHHRAEVEPVDQGTLASFLPAWQGVGQERSGPDALLDVVAQLQGCGMIASELENEILPARLADYHSHQLDALISSGALRWRGLSPHGTRDARISIYTSEDFDLLNRPVEPAAGDLQARLRSHLAGSGASFFPELLDAVGGYAQEVADALWDLVWAGEVTNDTLAPVRGRLRQGSPGPARARSSRARSHRRATMPPGCQGRWSLIPSPNEGPTRTQSSAALVEQLLERHGVVARETARHESVPGGFSAIYPILRAMEESGKVRRGYFVRDLGAAQFALPGVEDQLRARRTAAKNDDCLMLAATDPCNPYGATLPWPGGTLDGAARPQRATGGRVFLWKGRLVGYMRKGGTSLTTFLAELSEERGNAVLALARALLKGRDARRRVELEMIDGLSATDHPEAEAFAAAGFTPYGTALLSDRD
jgi:ATP-dependent Lhr-like helicase